jgi:hypothetical protein
VTNARVQVRYRKDRGLWEVDYRDGQGQRHRPLFTSEEDDHRHATEMLRALGQYQPVGVDRDVTIAAYAEQWLVAIETEKETATVRSYTERLRRQSCRPWGT